MIETRSSPSSVKEKSLWFVVNGKARSAKRGVLARQVDHFSAMVQAKGFSVE